MTDAVGLREIGGSAVQQRQRVWACRCRTEAIASVLLSGAWRDAMTEMCVLAGLAMGVVAHGLVPTTPVVIDESFDFPYEKFVLL